MGMKTLGYLGLGVMGYGMTGNLIDKSGCDIYGRPRARFAGAVCRPGRQGPDDAKTLYKTCDIIFMCLPTNAIVKATITEIMETARPGTTIVDMGSTSPYVIQEPTPRRWRRASICWTPRSAAARPAPTAAPWSSCAAARKRSLTRSGPR